MREQTFKSEGRLDETRPYAGSVATAPPPGQVISADELEEQLEQQYEHKVNGWSWRNTLTLLLVIVGANAIRDAGWMRLLPAYMVCYGVVTIVEYWIPPRPPQSFVSWALKVVGVILNLYVGLVTLPASLKNSLPTPLAYGLPAFVVFLIFYWVPPLYPIKRKNALWKWVIGAAAFAALWGSGSIQGY